MGGRKWLLLIRGKQLWLIAIVVIKTIEKMIDKEMTEYPTQEEKVLDLLKQVLAAKKMAQIKLEEFDLKGKEVCHWGVVTHTTIHTQLSKINQSFASISQLTFLLPLSPCCALLYRYR